MSQQKHHYKLYQPAAKSCGKVQYAHKHEAEQAAEEAMLMQPGLVLRVYKCINCRKWHLTSVKQVENTQEST